MSSSSRLLGILVVALALANVGVKSAFAEPEREGTCVHNQSPFPGVPDNCSCSWLGSPKQCDILVGQPMINCALVDGVCVPQAS